MAQIRKLVGAVVALAACHAAVAPAPVPPLITAPIVEAGAPVAVADAGDPTYSPIFEATLAEIDRRHDWRSSVFGTRMPNPPNPLRAKPVPEKGSISLSRVASIRAYRFQHRFTAGDAWDFGSNSEPAENMPYAKNGSLDGHVFPPEATLDDGERDRMLAVLRGMEEGERERQRHHAKIPAIRGGGTPDWHHVIVLFDAKDVPIAKLLTCSGCSEFRSIPATSQFGDVGSEAFLEAYLDIAKHHGLAASGYWNEEVEDSFSDYVTRRYGTSGQPTPLGLARYERLHAQPSTVPPDVIASKATPEERERFCVWLRAEIAGRDKESKYGRITGGWDCNDGKGGPEWIFDDTRPPHTDDCEKKPMCNAPFAKIEACFRTTFLGLTATEICARGGATPECAGLLDCLPYVERRTLP